MTKITNPGLIVDPKALNSIKENSNKAEGLAQAADQFETLFLQMVLKSMRNASEALSDEDSLVSSKQQRMYQDMYDGQLTMAMANKGSIGIADAMVNQLSNNVEMADKNNLSNKTDEPLKSASHSVANQEVSSDSFRQSLIKINKPGA